MPSAETVPVKLVTSSCIDASLGANEQSRPSPDHEMTCNPGCLLRFRRRRDQPSSQTISEAQAYARCHGDRTGDVAITVRPRPPITVQRPRRPLQVTLDGEMLRRAFEVRLASRRTSDSSS
jgi:hypothetical protein